jgi:hypothetical protein
MSEQDYRRITYDIVLAAATVLGISTDSTERGRTMWAEGPRVPARGNCAAALGPVEDCAVPRCLYRNAGDQRGRRGGFLWPGGLRQAANGGGIHFFGASDLDAAGVVKLQAVSPIAAAYRGMPPFLCIQAHSTIRFLRASRSPSKAAVIGCRAGKHPACNTGDRG